MIESQPPRLKQQLVGNMLQPGDDLRMLQRRNEVGLLAMWPPVFRRTYSSGQQLRVAEAGVGKTSARQWQYVLQNFRDQASCEYGGSLATGRH